MQRLAASETLLVTAICLWSAAFFFIIGESSFVLTRNEAAGAVSQLLAHRWDANTASYWASYASTGNDVLAMGKSPEAARLLFATLPGWVAYAGSHLIQNAAAVAGTYLLGRQTLGLARPGATFAAIAVGGAVSLGALSFTAVYLTPLLIVIIKAPMRRPTNPLAWAALIAALVAYVHLSVINYLFVFPAIFIVLWFIVIERETCWRRWLLILTICLLMHVLRWQDVMALVHNVPLSDRVEKQLFDITLWDSLVQGMDLVWTACLSPRGAIVVLPYPYITVHKILVVMLALTFWVVSRTQPLMRALALAGAVLATQAVLPFASKLTGTVINAANTFSANKLVEFFVFPLALAAGGMVDSLGTRRRAWASGASLALFAVASLGNGAYASHQWLTQGSWRHIFQSPIIEALAGHVRTLGEPARVASFRMYDDYVQGYGLDSIGGYYVMVPNRFFKYWLKMTEADMAANPELRGMHSDGATFYFGVVASQRDDQPDRRFGDQYNLNMLSLANMRYVLSRDQLTDPALRQLDLSSPDRPWSTMSVRDKLMVNARANFTGRTQLYVYENIEALPRFFLATSLIPINSIAEIYDRLGTEKLEVLRREILVDRHDLPSGYDAPRHFAAGGTITPVVVGGDRVELEVRLDGPSLLFASNAFSPFWHCFADGAEIPILPGHGAFWVVELPAATRLVSFVYTPPYRSVMGGSGTP